MNNNLLALIALGANKPQFKLNSEGKIPEEYLPSYVDDVIELIAVSDTAPSSCSKGDKYFNTFSKKIFTATSNNTWGSTGKTPEKDKIYINTAEDPATSWRWSGSDLVLIGGSNNELPVLTVLMSQMISETEFTMTQEQMDILRDPNNGIFWLDGADIGFTPGLVVKTNAYIEFSSGDYIVIITSTFPASNKNIRSIMGRCDLTTGVATLSITDAIGFGNEEIYTPTQDYHPATKKYVDDNAGLDGTWYFIPRTGTWSLGESAKPVLVDLLNSYLKNNIIPRASVALNSSYYDPEVSNIGKSNSGSDAYLITIHLKGLYFWHSSNSSWGVSSKDIRYGGSINVYVNKEEWDAKHITAVYYGRYQSTQSSLSIITDTTSLRAISTSGSQPIGANYTIAKYSTLPTASQSIARAIYWFDGPRYYDTNTQKWIEPGHLYYCDREKLESGSYLWVDYIERQSLEAQYKALGLEAYTLVSEYAVGDYCYFKGKIYKALVAKTSTSADFTPSNWEEVSYIDYLKIVLAA